jgi:hypothetical protein
MFAWRLGWVDGKDGQRIRLLASSDGTLFLCVWIYRLCGERSQERERGGLLLMGREEVVQIVSRK